ncbi:MAG: penicillin-binding transpeptidase domain-containing protein [Clostridia bacterium]|nr:penicillin-binding transpeptidase domain-containing protein [Clostridia bacterium]
MHITNLTVRKRLLVALITAIFLFLGIFTRFFYIQVVWGKQLRQKAVDQWTRDLPITADRGLITDCNGNVIVNNVTAYTVYVRAKNVVDADKVSTILSQHLNIDYDRIYSKVTDKSSSEWTIKRQVSADTVSALREYNLEGVYYATQSVRNYVYGDFLTQVLGFVSVDSVGQTGIEAYYDKYLSGIDGALLTQSDLVGKELYDTSMQYVAPIDGFTIQLTIDCIIQQIVENVLKVAMQAHSPKHVQCVVLDVTNGQILAMAQNPSYNLNDIPRDDISTLMELSRNTIITDIYEPGSTFKVLTAAATLEESRKGNPKAFDENHVFTNNSDVRYLDGTKIKCWTKHIGNKHANQTLAMALNHSCNPIFTDIALALGTQTFYGYLQAFGYGSKTGVDFLGEQAGLLVDEQSVTVNDLARIGFGQTIAVTALQLAVATAACVNGGYLYQPYFVKQIIDPVTGNVVKTMYPTLINRPISQETSKLLATMLQGVVTEGSGKQAYIEGYQVGGKTGTAQKYVNGAVATGKNISSFVGFFPASAPKYLCLFIVDEPVGVTYGSVVAAPYTRMIFQSIIDYYDIAPIQP